MFIWGPPGVGKSAVVAQFAESMKLRLTDRRASNMDPVDVRSLPHWEEKLYRWVWPEPEFFPLDKKSKGILFLDEINVAPPLVQAALYQLVLDRRVGDHMLPPGWIVLAAGNREGDKGVTHRMPMPLRNRFASHLEFDVDAAEWITWAVKHAVHPDVVAYIRFRPARLFDFDPKRNDNAFPTPRTWEFTSDMLKTTPASAIEHRLIAGCVGEGDAIELMAFRRMRRDMVSMDAIFASPKTAAVPTEASVRYAVAGLLAHYADEKNLVKIMDYTERLPVEFQGLVVHDMTQSKPALMATKAFIGWASRHSQVTI
jgi:hypothetical protein